MSNPTFEELKEMHSVNKFSVMKIARITGITQSKVRSILKEGDYIVRPRGGLDIVEEDCHVKCDTDTSPTDIPTRIMRKNLKSPEEVIAIVKKKAFRLDYEYSTMTEMAMKYNCSVDTIRFVLSEYKIEVRTAGSNRVRVDTIAVGNDYTSGMSNNKLCKKYSISRPKLKSTIKEFLTMTNEGLVV